MLYMSLEQKQESYWGNSMSQAASEERNGQLTFRSEHFIWAERAEGEKPVLRGKEETQAIGGYKWGRVRVDKQWINTGEDGLIGRSESAEEGKGEDGNRGREKMLWK